MKKCFICGKKIDGSHTIMEQTKEGVTKTVYAHNDCEIEISYVLVTDKDGNETKMTVEEAHAMFPKDEVEDDKIQ